MEKNKKKYGLLVAVALCVCLLGGFLANLAQTDFGKVTKKTILFESNSGHTISADVLIPNEAGEENPLPAIVWALGGNANKERSDNFQIEWARRGYVVVSFDLYGHGESEVLNDTEWFDNGRGLYDTVQYVATLPYVDADRIAVSGHSRGGNTIHESVLLDNELETPLIKAILYVGRDAIYRDNETASFGYFPGKTNTTQAAEKGGNGEYFNYYGNRDVGIIADKYDDFSFKEKDEKTGEAVPRGAGVKDIVKAVGNYERYSYLTLERFDRIITRIFDNRVDTTTDEIVLYCGKGFAREFNDAIYRDARLKNYFMALGDANIDDSAMWMSYGRYFNRYRLINGKVITVKCVDIFDQGIRARQDREAGRMYKGLPVTSYTAVFLDHSMNVNGERNIKFVCEEGREYKVGVYKGMAELPASWGAVSSNLISDTKDIASYEVLGSQGINIDNPTTCFWLDLGME